MNTTRVVFFSILYASFLFALYSGARVLYVLFFSLAFLLLAAFVMSIWSAFTFAFIQEISASSTVRDGTLTIHLEIHNERPLPYPLMRLRVRTPRPGRYWETTFNLPAHAHASFDVPVPCPYRGVFQVGLSVVDIRDIFGLLTIPFRMSRLPYYREKSILVYPRVAQLPERSIRPPDAKTYTRFSVSNTDSEESFSHARTYRPGDRARQIHWKLSSRMGELYSRQYDMATEPSMLVLMDMTPGPYKPVPSLEWQDTACSCAATLISYVLQHHYRVTLVASGADRLSLPGNSMADFHPFLESLATIPFDGLKPAHEFVGQESNVIKEHGSIVFITHQEPDDRLLSTFRPLQRTDADFTVIVARPAVLQMRNEREFLLNRLSRHDSTAPQAPTDTIGNEKIVEIDSAQSRGPRVIRVAYGDDLPVLLGDFI